jgi:HemK-related putative methylase
MKVKEFSLAGGARALRRLAERLRAAEYGPGALRDLLGVALPDDVGLLNHAGACERLRDVRTPGATAVRLWYLETALRPPECAGLFSAADRQVLADARLVRARAARVVPRLRIDVYGSLYVLADRRFAAPDGGALGWPRGDMVYPPGSDSAVLADAVPQRDGERVLDLCTGSGIQALAVAKRAASVLAVDIGPRAAAAARCNALLNGIENVEVRCGHLFAPVAGERFDLLLANPPFVPAPERGPAYHSGGPRGDRVLRQVIGGLGAALRRGGRALIISHLALRADQGVADALRPWFGAFAGRVLTLVLEAGSPVDLAAAQALFALDDGFAAYAAEIRRWRRYLEHHAVDRVVLLLIAAEYTGRPDLEVVDAFQRTLPLPLSQPPRALIDSWLRRV